MLAIVISANLISCAQTPAKDANNGYKAEQEGWLVNLDEAYALSKKTNKPIMANFTGSDWCGWCKRLSAAVFVKDDFKAWAKKNVILLELDFPRGKAIPDAIRTQNANLQQAFQVSGYPTIWVFDLEKDKKTNQYQINALGKTGYTATVQEFTSGVDQMIAKRTAK
ncbi:MAG TPA: thioredoxin family protein [Saprospiraceae bacterium]|nr:thioredoxin family protein [Saprospiraceae bacterium]